MKRILKLLSVATITVLSVSCTGTGRASGPSACERELTVCRLSLETLIHQNEKENAWPPKLLKK